MTTAADNDDRWLHRLIFDFELTDDQKVHPAAWERFRPNEKVPQCRYVLSGTSWKLGRRTFLTSAAAVVTKINQRRTSVTKAGYRGLIYQFVYKVRRNCGALALDVRVVGNDLHDPAHAILVTTAELKEQDGSISPDVAEQLNQLFCLALANSPEERQALGP